MKKTVYSLSGGVTSIDQRESSPMPLHPYRSRQSQSFSYDSEASYIFDRPSHFSMKLEKEDQERYLNSFLKKKILRIWKQQRSLVKTVPTLPEVEAAIHQDVYQKLKPLLSAAYHEDFDFPLMPFTLFGWLQYAKITAQVVGKHSDTAYWDEMTSFFQQCSKWNLLHDLIDE